MFEQGVVPEKLLGREYGHAMLTALAAAVEVRCSRSSASASCAAPG
jgi:hypothetical protein